MLDKDVDLHTFGVDVKLNDKSISKVPMLEICRIFNLYFAKYDIEGELPSKSYHDTTSWKIIFTEIVLDAMKDMDDIVPKLPIRKSYYKMVSHTNYVYDCWI
jgi:hypothetical protein